MKRIFLQTILGLLLLNQAAVIYGESFNSIQQRKWEESIDSWKNDKKTTEQLWQDHIDAWEARDLEKILEDYTEDSVVITNGEVHRGLAAISQVFENLFEIFDRAERHQIDPVVIPDPQRIIYLSWSATIDGVDYPFGTDTFVIENGTITHQTISSFPALP